ncbi:MAG: DUF3034 family protein, partial [Algicola sp.]|nr:DUF3034 family protein [Algicola sp.]
LVPWAVLSGYATDDQWATSVFSSRSTVDDYSLETIGFAINYHDRLELSYARMTFGIDAGAPDIRMNVVGAKYRLFGDVVYSDMPQVSIGIQHKSVVDFAIPTAVGAKDDSGTDVYITASKVWLDGPFHRTVLLDLNARLSKANQIGLLGFGGDENNDYDLSFEGAAGLFLNRHWLVGVEYRQKSDHLSAVKEDDWFDFFVTYLPNKSLSITAAYLNLGDIAGAPDQTGYYISLQGAF